MPYLKLRVHFNAFSVVGLMLLLTACRQKATEQRDWDIYRGNKASNGYSSLQQINKGNLSKLKMAWTFHSGDAREGNRSTIQCNPLIVNGLMYVTSPQLKLIALHPASGKEVWRFDPFTGEEATGVNRGLTYWADGNDRRIFFSAGTYLYALRADDGTLIPGFGDSGRVDLRIGLGREPSALAVWATSPGIIYKDLLIQGTALGEGYDAAPGFIRAYNVKTGKMVWTFHTIPQPDEYGYDTWDTASYREVGGVNAWAGMSLDEETGIVYAPLGSPAFDFYGGNRRGDNLFGNCLIALDAATGRRIWHYQLVHHDLWDYDLPAPPVLLSVNNNGVSIKAVAQVTKMGMVFLFDRNTGKPVFPVHEQPVPASRLPGEYTSPVQPFPEKPQPFVRQHFSPDDITDISDTAHSYVSGLVRSALMGGIYTPPDTAGVVQFPGTRGGAEWGGAAVDPLTGIMYVNANEVPMFIKMKAIPFSSDNGEMSPGEKLYTLNNCTMCHGADRKGTAVFPSLLNIKAKYTRQKVAGLLTKGKGQMPAFPNLTPHDKEALLDFLFDKANRGKKQVGGSDSAPYRYVHNGWQALSDTDGYPGVKPPWGTLNAIDLNKGELLWKVPLGEFPGLVAKGIRNTGTPNLGGALVTAGGLLIIAATYDEKLRIFNKENGQLLWEYKLPAGGYATPATYMIDGRQYIVIAAGGGGKVGSPSGDAYVAFCLGE